MSAGTAKLPRSDNSQGGGQSCCLHQHSQSPRSPPYLGQFGANRRVPTPSFAARLPSSRKAANAKVDEHISSVLHSRMGKNAIKPKLLFDCSVLHVHKLGLHHCTVPSRPWAARSARHFFGFTGTLSSLPKRWSMPQVTTLPSWTASALN